MKKTVKIIINFLLKKIVDFLYLFNIGRYIIEKLQFNKFKKTFINYKNKEYSFFIPNRLNHFRAETF